MMKKIILLLVIFIVLFLTRIPSSVRASPMKSNTKVGTYFFNWYTCDGNSCWFGNRYGYIPDFMYAPYPEGGYISSLNKNYFQREFYDMYSAGIDYALIVSWGDHPWPWYRVRTCPWWYNLQDSSKPRGNPPQDTNVIANCGADLPHEQGTGGVLSSTDIMVKALNGLEAKGISMKVGLFDDTGSEPAEYNLYQRGMINGEIYSDNKPIGYDSAYKPFPLCDASAVDYFYNAKYKPFFQKIPTKFWATHNGLPPEQGGRPIIVVYNNSDYANNECSPQVFGEVYNRFRGDFGINPYIIVDRSWVQSNPSLLAHVDNQTLFGSAIVDGDQAVSDTKDNYTVSTVGPGFNNTIMNPTNPGVWSRNNGSTFEGRFNNTPSSDLLIVETWNELGERTSIARAKGYDCDSNQVGGCGYCDDTHPQCTVIQPNQSLSATYYMNKLRQLSGRTNRSPIKSLNELADFFSPPPSPTSTLPICPGLQQVPNYGCTFTGICTQSGGTCQSQYSCSQSGSFTDCCCLYPTPTPTLTPILPSPTNIPPSPTSVPTTPIPGDITGPLVFGVPDGKVDIYDYNLLIRDFGKSGSPADIDGNGIVNIFDYNTLIGNFGHHT